jgi:hypothetical protein
MRHICTLALLLSCAACGGSTTSTPEGPLKLGIVAGNNQVAPAGSVKLTDPVVGRLVRVSTASGPRFEFVKTAYAQTVVTGSPVPGAVVCAVSMTAGSMVPFVPCTNTDADGKATFFFTPGTKAGEAESEIRGTLAGQPAVFDTATATVLPGPAVKASGGQCNTGQPGCYLVSVGDVLDLHMTFTQAFDQYDNSIDLTGIVPSYAIRGPCGSGEANCFPPPAGLTPDGSGWTLTVDPKWAHTKVFLYVFLGGNVVVTWPLSIN